MADYPLPPHGMSTALLATRDGQAPCFNLNAIFPNMRLSRVLLSRSAWTVRNRTTTFSAAAHSPVVQYNIFGDAVHPPSLVKALQSATLCASLRTDTRYPQLLNRIIESLRNNPLDWNAEEIVTVVVRAVHIRSTSTAQHASSHARLGPLFGVVIRILTDRLDSTPPDSLCQLAWAITLPPHGVRDHSFLHKVALSVAPSLSYVAQNSLTKLIQALAVRGDAPRVAVRACVRDVLLRLAQRRPLTPAEIAIVASSLAKLEVTRLGANDDIPLQLQTPPSTDTLSVPDPLVVSASDPVATAVVAFASLAAASVTQQSDFRPREEATAIHAFTRAVLDNHALYYAFPTPPLAAALRTHTIAGGDEALGGVTDGPAPPDGEALRPIEVLVDRVAHRIVTEPTWYNAHEVSNVLWCSGKLYAAGLYTSASGTETEPLAYAPVSVSLVEAGTPTVRLRAAHQRLLDHSVRLLSSSTLAEFNGLEVAKALHGVASTAARGAAVDAMCEFVFTSLRGRIGSYSNVDIATTVHSLSKLVTPQQRASSCDAAAPTTQPVPVTGDIELDDIVDVDADDHAGFTLSPAATEFYAAVAAVVVDTITDYRVHDLANVMAAFARINLRPPALISVAVSRSRDVVPSGRPEALGRLAWALQRLGVSDERTFSDIFQNSLLWLPQFKPHELCNLAWAASKVDPAILTAISAVAASSIGAYHGRALVNIISDCSHPSVTTNSSIVHLFLVAGPQVANEIDIGRLTPSGCSTIANAYLTVRPPNLNRVLAKLLFHLLQEPSGARFAALAAQTKVQTSASCAGRTTVHAAQDAIRSLQSSTFASPDDATVTAAVAALSHSPV